MFHWAICEQLILLRVLVEIKRQTDNMLLRFPSALKPRGGLDSKQQLVLVSIAKIVLLCPPRRSSVRRSQQPLRAYAGDMTLASVRAAVRAPDGIREEMENGTWSPAPLLRAAPPLACRGTDLPTSALRRRSAGSR